MAKQQQNTDITSMSLVELKALAFDQMNLIGQSQKNLEVIQKQMGILAEASKPVEVGEAVEV